MHQLAGLLRAGYRRWPDGHFNLATSIDLFDGDGRIAGHLRHLSAVDMRFLALVHRVAAAPFALVSARRQSV
jgi:hypothetical protein